MNLTTAQYSTLKTHLQANTNTVTFDNGATFTVNTSAGVTGHDPTFQAAIAKWYNDVALATDAQAPANLLLWNPVTTTTLLNTAIVWTDEPAGADDTARIKNWLKWQSMCWSGFIDLSDQQVRGGVNLVWSASTATLNAIGSTTLTALCGKLAGRRIDLVLANAVTGTNNINGGAHTMPRGATAPILSYMNGNVVVPAQTLTQLDIEKAITG